MSYDTAITIRMDSDMLAKLDAYRERVSKETGFQLTRVEVARKLIADGIAASAPQKRKRQ